MRISSGLAMIVALVVGLGGCSGETSGESVGSVANAQRAAETPPRDGIARSDHEEAELESDRKERASDASGGELDDGSALESNVSSDEDGDATASPAEAATPLQSGAERSAALLCASRGSRCGDIPCCNGLECRQLVCKPPPPPPILAWGLHPRASNALRDIGIGAGRIMQTIGGAPDSAGTHLQDGTHDGEPYSAATDIRTSGLTSARIKADLEDLGRKGFAAWYRAAGEVGPDAHIHAVFANALMKESLRSQVVSWLDGRNGLIGNAPYGFYSWSAAAKRAVRNKFEASGGGTHN